MTGTLKLLDVEIARITIMMAMESRIAPRLIMVMDGKMTIIAVTRKGDEVKMTGREKVIRAVETCFDSWIDKHQNMGLDLHEVKQMERDALELLKEQETTLEKDGHHIRCLNCGEYWCDSDREGNPFPMNFCPNCGGKVKWND